MGPLLSKKQRELDYCDAPKIVEKTEQIKSELQKIRIEKDGTVVISKPVVEKLLEEFQNLISTFQSTKDGFYIDGAVIDSLQEIMHPSTLKYKDNIADSNQNAEDPESRHNKIKQAESKEMTKDQKEMAKCEHPNVPVKYQQLATAFEVVKQLPETLRVLGKWIKSEEKTMGASIILTRYMMDIINEQLVLDTVTVGSDNSIELSRGTVETILQHSQEYINFIEEKRSNNCQFTEKLTSNEDLNTNQTLGPPREPLKYPLRERKQPVTYIKVLNPLSSGATNVFITTLQDELEQKGIKLDMTDVHSFNDDETGSNLVMVICNNHSRLQANVASVFKDIHRNRFHRILLAIIHCKKERLLPSLSSKAELKDDEEYGVIPEVVDFAFDKEDTRGRFYECEFNNKAFETITSLIESGSLSTKQTETRRSSSKKQKTTE